jgi:CheY-like chemotaxis protein
MDTTPTQTLVEQARRVLPGGSFGNLPAEMMIREGKAGLRAQTIWIAALTADARDDQRQRAFEVGANDYLTKPLRLPELEASMRRSREARGGNR